MELYHTIGYLISHQEKKEENNIEEEENDEIIKYSIPAIVSYSKNNIIHEITLTLPTKEIFLINSEQLSHLYLDNNCLFIPLPTSPYLEITLMQFCDTFMIELGKSHLLYQRRKLTPRQFYGKSSRHTIFSIFPRQELAFQFYDEQIEKESLKIFSFEAPLTGRRKFLVSDMNTFHHKYRCNINRHVYEIIREGYPCRLYFDIEYSKETNPDVNGEFVVELWISLVLWKLDELYGIVIPSRNIIHLDSSTEKKFSRHIIFLLLQKGVISKPKLSVVQSCLPSTSEYIEYLFHDNLEVGQFVLLVMLECLCDHESLPSEVPFLLPRQFQQQHVKRSYSDLWLFNSDRSSRVFAIDLGVYTRNRAFRCFSSTKYGKLAILGVQHPSQATLLRIPPRIETVTADVSYNLLNGKLEEDCWYFPSYEWSFRSSTTDEALQRKIRCTEKIISDSITQFNYFV